MCIRDRDTTMTKNEDRINKLFKELVPDTGKADSLAGELVRAMSRIGYRFYNDGDQLGIGYGKETCNPAGRFLGVKGNDKIAKLTADAVSYTHLKMGKEKGPPKKSL